MPLYTYRCTRHGEFSAWGSMSESDAPQPCPACAEPAGRALARPAIGGRGEGVAPAGGPSEASVGGTGHGCACAGHCPH